MRNFIHKNKNFKKGLKGGLTTLSLFVALGVSQTAHAWKPTTHVYLADYAYEDVVDDGQVTFDLLDPDTGEKVRTLGPYKVSPELVEILRKNRP